MSRTAAVLDSPQTSEGQAWWFLDTLVVEHLMASGTGPVVLEMTLPAGAAPRSALRSFASLRSAQSDRSAAPPVS